MSQFFTNIRISDTIFFLTARFDYKFVQTIKKKKIDLKTYSGIFSPNSGFF